jgi:hypothetical protein
MIKYLKPIFRPIYAPIMDRIIERVYGCLIDEIHKERLNYQANLTQLTQQIQETSQQYFAAQANLGQRFTQELQQTNQQHLDFQAQLTQQVADEFVKMHKIIDDVKNDRTDEKLNIIIVNELIKIHASIEGLKLERNNNHKKLS